MQNSTYNAGMNAFNQGKLDEAYEWFMKSPEDAGCQYALGIMHYNGEGATKSYKLSTQFFTKAADQGVIPAQQSAGFAYANALGVPEDFDKAAHYLKSAASAGDLPSIITLGEIYAMNRGGGNRDEAAKMLKPLINDQHNEEALDVWNRYELWKLN
jgi:TPR repeat protein